MIDSNRYFTVVYKDVSQGDRHNLYFSIPEKVSASSYSHALDDRDQLLSTLCHVDRVLVDLSLEGDHRVHSLLATVRNLLKEHGRVSKAENPEAK